MKRSLLKVGGAIIIITAIFGFLRNAQASLPCDLATLQALAPAGTTLSSVAEQSSPVAYCQVIGTIATSSSGEAGSVLFELGLPDAWAGRFLFLGNGGFAGSLQAVDSGDFAFYLPFGFAVAATDTGHESLLGVLGELDGSFALLPNGQPNLAAREDFSYRAVHQSTVIGQQITNGYYSSSFKSYFFGCSTGGRQALVEAQKFPGDYNGILAGDPAIGNPVGGFTWNEESLLANGASWLSPQKIALLDKTVLQACDAVDGVVDGMIENPTRCNFNPAVLQCKGPLGPLCLSPKQVQTLRQMYTGAVGAQGRVYPGYTVSDPGQSDGWPAWSSGFLTPTAGTAEPWGPTPLPSLADAPAQFSFADQFMKYFVFDDVNYDLLSFDLNDPTQLAALNAVITEFGGNGVNTNLSPFFNGGGKLIMYHGWSDPALTPLISTGYYNSVARGMGGVGPLQQDARLFMVPGMHHCGGGPGPNTFDALTPLTAWVETATAPASIIASHTDASTGPLRDFPLCPYPKQAVYVGGNPFDVTSWSCPALDPPK